MRRLSYGILLFVCLINAASANDWGAWGEAKQHYDAGDFDRAIESIRANPLAHPPSDPNYFFNLGTLYSLTGRPGLAVAHLEKAKQLRPLDSRIDRNLKQARDALGRLIGAERLDPGANWFETLGESLPMGVGLIRAGLGALSVFFALFWGFSYAKTRRFLPTLGSPFALLGIASILGSLGLAAAQAASSLEPAAACLEAGVIRSGPGDHFLELSRIETGMKVRLLGPSAQSQPGDLTTPPETSGEVWRQVRYAPDGIGWVRGSSVLLLQ